MPRHKITNTFMKGMNQDKTWTKADQDSYRESSNLRPTTDDMGNSTGALATVRGNMFNFELPDLPDSYLLVGDPTFLSGLTGSPSSMTITIGGVSSTFNYVATEVDVLYEQLANHINTTYAPNVAAQFNENGVAVYSPNQTPIGGVASGGNFTVSILGSGGTFFQVIGYTNIRESVILFVSNNGGQSAIWKVTWDALDQATLKLIRHVNDGFSLPFDIEARGRYETESIQRVYWTDDNNDLRSLNIESESSFLDKIDLVPDVNYTIPYVESINQTGGSLVVGWYSYAYKQKVLGGAEAAFSRWSAPFPITEDNEDTAEYWEYKGAFEGTTTKKSLTVTIPDIDTTFSHIDVIVMYQKDLTSKPEYYFVEENRELTGATSFTFSHSIIDPVKYIDEADIFIETSVFNRCKTITIKDNRLLAGNVKDDTSQINNFVTFVPRYPANSTTTSNGYENTVDKTNPYNKDSTRAKTSPLQNKYKYNSTTLGGGGNGSNIEYEFVTKKFKLDGYALGDPNPKGSAARINLFGANSTINTATVNNRTVQMGGYWNNFKNPFFASHFRGYMRAETYRFGIVFFDKTGRALQVQWIDDIRMPEQSEIHAYDTDSTGTWGYSLGVKFDVTIPAAIKNRVSGFSIVRAERKSTDETIIGQGYMTDIGIKFMDTGSTLDGFLRRLDRVTEWGGTYGGTTEIRPELKALHVPRLLIKNQAVDLNGIKIRPIAAISPASYGVIDAAYQTTNDSNFGGREKWRWDKFFQVKLTDDYFRDNDAIDNIIDRSVTITDTYPLAGQFSGAPTANIADSFFVFGGFKGLVNYASPFGTDKNFNNSSWFGNNTQQFRARGGHAHIVKGDSNKFATLYYSRPGSNSQGANSRILPSAYYNGHNQNGNPRWWITESQKRLSFNLYRELNNQYGGSTKSNIEATEYISTGHFQPVKVTDVNNTYTCEVFGGDTYVTVYGQNDFITHNVSGGTPFANFPFQPSNDEAFGNGTFFIVESKLNLDWRQGLHINVFGTSVYPSVNPINWTDDLDFLRQPANIDADWQSRQNDHQKFLSLGSFFNITNEWDNRIWASEAKINGESIDSWSNFKVNNLMDVDGDLGPINKLETFNDDVFYFQDRGFGRAIVNPNPIIQGSDNITMALGTGKVLHDFNYISTNVGTKHQWSVFTSPAAIYWFDILNRKPFRFTAGKPTEELSDMKGMHSFFIDHVDNNILEKDNPATGIGIRGGYDFLHKEAFFTFFESKTTLKDTAQSYAELSQFFGGPGGLVPEGSQVEYLDTKNVLDDNGNVIATTTYSRSFDVIQSYPIDTVTLIPAAYRNPTYLKERPSYLGTDFTIAYSEAMNAWSTLYDFTPTIYINTKSRLLTPNYDYKRRIHLHNVGDYNKFYGETFHSILEVVTNTAPDKTKVFDNVSWHTNARTKDGAQGQTLDQVTFGEYYCWNDYQHSGIITLDPTNNDLRRVEREWQTFIPRNVVTETGANIDVLNPANWDLTRTFNDRMRDKYLVQHFDYDASQSDQFIINYINTYVRTSDR